MRECLREPAGSRKLRIAIERTGPVFRATDVTRQPHVDGYKLQWPMPGYKMAVRLQI